MSTLPRVITDLTRPHISRRVTGRGEELVGLEPPLLLVLERAVGSSIGGSAGSPGPTSGSPVNLAALELWSSVVRYISMARWGVSALHMERNTSVAEHLERLAEETVGTQAFGDLLDTASGWSLSINDLIDPPRRMPLRGMACPSCGETWAAAQRDGERVRVEALVAWTTTGYTPGVECLHCTQSWEGREVHDLKAAICADGSVLEGSVV